MNNINSEFNQIYSITKKHFNIGRANLRIMVNENTQSRSVFENKKHNEDLSEEGFVNIKQLA